MYIPVTVAMWNMPLHRRRLVRLASTRSGIVWVWVCMDCFFIYIQGQLKFPDTVPLFQHCTFKELLARKTNSLLFAICFPPFNLMRLLLIPSTKIVSFAILIEQFVAYLLYRTYYSTHYQHCNTLRKAKSHHCNTFIITHQRINPQRSNTPRPYRS